MEGRFGSSRQMNPTQIFGRFYSSSKIAPLAISLRFTQVALLTSYLLLVKFSTALICFCNNSDLCHTTEDRFLPYTNFPKRREYTKTDSMN